MKFDQKMAWLLNAIHEASLTDGKITDVKLFRTTENHLDQIDLYEVQQLLIRLQNREKVIAIKGVPAALEHKTIQGILANIGEFLYFSVDILEGFEKLREQFPVPDQKKSEKNLVENASDIILTLSMVDTQLLINGIFLVAKPNYDKQNYHVMEYLLQNPNRKVTNQEIKEKRGLISLPQFSKVLDHMKIRGDLRQLFFRTSKDSIELINPITRKRLDELNIKFLDLNPKNDPK